MPAKTIKKPRIVLEGAGFLSTTVNKAITKQYTGSYSTVVYHITVPEGCIFLAFYKRLNELEGIKFSFSQHQNETEFLFPRGPN